jgi:hypothetical protein
MRVELRAGNAITPLGISSSYIGILVISPAFSYSPSFFTTNQTLTSRITVATPPAFDVSDPAKAR